MVSPASRKPRIRTTPSICSATRSKSRASGLVRRQSSIADSAESTVPVTSMPRTSSARPAAAHERRVVGDGNPERSQLLHRCAACRPRCTSRQTRRIRGTSQLTSTDKLKEERGVDLACRPVLREARKRAAIGIRYQERSSHRERRARRGERRTVERFEKLRGWLVRPRIRLEMPIRAPFSLVAHAASSSLLIIVIDCDRRSLGTRPQFARKGRLCSFA